MAKLTAEQRRQRARLAANARWAREDPTAHAARMRAAGPAADAYWERQVDPDGELSVAERQRRAQSAKRAHFQRLAFRSSRARQAAAEREADSS